MGDKTFAVITLAITSLFGLLVTIVTNRLTASREDRDFKRQLKRENLEATRTLYEDALFMLERLVIQRGRGDKAEQDEFTRMLARLSLRSTNEIKNLYEQAAESALDWAAEYRKSQPEQTGGMLWYKSGVGKYTEEAEALYPKFQEKFIKLKTIMAEHLSNIENEM